MGLPWVPWGSLGAHFGIHWNFSGAPWGSQECTAEPELRKTSRAGVREGIKGRVIFSYIEEDNGTEAPLADLHALRPEASADFQHRLV